MGKIVLYLAMSVDGYIADEQGGVGWLGGDGSEPVSYTHLGIINAPSPSKDHVSIFCLVSS